MTKELFILKLADNRHDTIKEWVITVDEKLKLRFVPSGRAIKNAIRER